MGGVHPTPPPPIEPQPPPYPAPPVIGYDPRLYDLLYSEFGRGQSVGQIYIIALTTGGVSQQLVQGSMKVKKAVIQSIATESVTLFTNASDIAPNGIVLNTGGVGNGGGSLTVGNVDLSTFWFVRASAGNTLAVYAEA